jgi:diguanylate cyclase (GGDEF)-like protein/PAS domain S-box-containing protein
MGEVAGPARASSGHLNLADKDLEMSLMEVDGRGSAEASAMSSGDPAFAETADLAAAICGAPFAAVTLMEDHRLLLLGVHGTQLTELPRQLALCDLTVTQQRPLVSADLEADVVLREHPAVTGGFGLKAYAGVPVHDGTGRTIGTLCVLDTKARPFSTLQVQALMTLAHQITSVLTLQERTRELARTTRLLEASREHSPVGMVLVALAGPSVGRLSDANPAFCELVGRTREELHLLTVGDLTHPDDKASSPRLLNDLLTGRTVQAQAVKRYLRPDGTSVWADLRATVLRDEADKPYQVLCHVFDVTDRVDREAELVSRALQDPLTGLPNRTHLVERLSNLPTDSPAVIVYLDLNGFKPVNDRFGHATGDQVLVRVAERMRGAVRSGDLLARVGGDEFVAVLSSDLPAARITAQRILDALSEPVVVGEARVSLGASAGLAAVVNGDWEVAIEAADAAMYDAKRNESGLSEA